MNQPYLSVVMPAYNEGQTLFNNLAVTVEACKEFHAPFEIVLVDDGSSDDTASEAARAAAIMPEIRVVSYRSNRGKGHAVLTGVRVAAGEVIAFLDADLDLHPRQLRTALEQQRVTGADVIIGSKWHPHSVVAFPFTRRVLSLGYYALIRVLFGLPVRDTQTGIKVYRREVMDQLADQITSRGFAFDLEMLVLAHRLGYRIQDVPVVVEAARLRSRIRPVEVYRVATDTLRVLWNITRPAGLWDPTAPNLPHETFAAKAGHPS